MKNPYINIKLILLSFLFTLSMGCSKDNLSYDGFIPISSSQRLVGWGDSMMFGTGGDHSILKVMSDELSNIPYFNFGVGGLKSENIAILQGGNPFFVELENNQIPSSGSSDLQSFTVDALNNKLEQFRYGTLQDIRGMLIRVADPQNPTNTLKYTFVREEPGDPVMLLPNSTFVFDDAVKNRNELIIIWAGRNDPMDAQGILETKANLQAMIDYLGEFGRQHYLIISVCNGIADIEGFGSETYQRIANLNAELSSTFGDRFIDLRRYMVDQAIFDLGMNPSEIDLTDMALDCIPRSLLSDHVHFNTRGYKAAGKFLAQTIKSLNWPLN